MPIRARLSRLFQRMYWQDEDASLGAKVWFALRSVALGMVLVPVIGAALTGVRHLTHPPPDSGFRIGMTARQMGRVRPGVYSCAHPKDRYGGWKLLRLPEHQHELAHYTGELYWADDSTGWAFMNGWLIEMRDGRVVEIRYQED